MADAVTKVVVLDSPIYHTIHMTNISDGTGESNVIKIDKSTLLGPGNIEPSCLDIQVVRWAVQGFSYVKLAWDHTTDDTGMVLCNSGFDDFRFDVDHKDAPFNAANRDPRSAGGTGDMLLTTAGAVSGASYDITLMVRKTAG